MKSIIIIYVLGIVLISGCTQSSISTINSSHSCLSVYETKGDYSDLESTELGNVNGSEKPIGGGLQPRNTRIKLHNGYMGDFYGCNSSDVYNIAFYNVSISEWKNKREGCKNQFGDYKNKIVVEKCGDPRFTWRLIKEPFAVGENWNGVLIAQSQTGQPRDLCYINLTADEQNEYTKLENGNYQCRYDIDMRNSNPEFIMGNIIDRNPFTQLYLCEVDLKHFSADDINNLIDEGQLNTKCEKII